MKQYGAFFICLLMTANLFCQERYPVPIRTYEQKFNRAMYIEWYWMGLAARTAKDDGKNLYEAGRKAGLIAAPDWGKKDDFDGLVRGWIFNIANYQREKDLTPVVKENQDGSVSIIADDNSSHDYFPERGLIAYDELLEYWNGAINAIAEYKGATATIEHQDSLLVFTFKRK